MSAQAAALAPMFDHASGMPSPAALNASLWEMACAALFLILSAITVYRKELSANRVYLEDDLQRDEKRLDSEGACEAIGMSFDHDRKVDIVAQLPDDVARLVLRYAGSEAVCTLQLVSRRHGEIAGRGDLWRCLWRDRWGSHLRGASLRPVLARRGTSLDAILAERPARGWKRAFYAWELSWLDWMLAGGNQEERCLLAIHGKLVDITSFLMAHPGSPDTILDRAGEDATSFFLAAGHTFHAQALMRSMVVVDMPAVRVPRRVRADVAARRAAALRAKGGALGLLPCSHGGGSACPHGASACCYMDAMRDEWRVWCKECGVEAALDV